MKGRTPEIRPPKFLTDLYRDLRDQRLLPLVILLLVAIPVVPFVLGDSTPTFVPPADDEGIAATITDNSLMVVSAPAGLRRHGERFSDRTPRDPFVDPNAPEPGATAPDTNSMPPVPPTVPVGDDPGNIDPPVGGGDVRPPSVPIPPAPPSSPGDRGGGSSGDGRPEDLRLFRLQTTVRFGKAGSGLLHTFEDLDRMRGLPHRQPIAIFIGAADDASRALFSISADAALVTGKGSCSSGRPKHCQFLSLKPGQAANIHDARRGVVWRLAVTSIDLVESQVKLGNADSKGQQGDQGGGGGTPAAEPIDPDVVQAASLSEVIGLYLLK